MPSSYYVKVIAYNYIQFIFLHYYSKGNNGFGKSFMQGGIAEAVSTPQELLEEATNLLGLEEEELPSTASTSASVVQVSSVVYLDCVSDQHQVS